MLVFSSLHHSGILCAVGLPAPRFGDQTGFWKQERNDFFPVGLTLKFHEPFSANCFSLLKPRGHQLRFFIGRTTVWGMIKRRRGTVESISC